MRVLHLSTYDLFGGAARAAFRLHVGLRQAGEESFMAVRQRRSDRADILVPGGRAVRLWRRLQRRIDRLPLAGKPATRRDFSIGWTPDALAGAIRRLAPDVVHVHWTADGFMRPDTLATIAAPVVWTMHDMWAFTGGCHYAVACRRFTATCGRCPLLGSERDTDFSRRGWEKRRQAFGEKAVTFVAPSRWMAAQARESSLLRRADIVVIPNGFDISRFVPQNQAAARAEFGLRADVLIVLAGAAQYSANVRKGFSHLVAGLESVRTLLRPGTVELALFGSETRLPGELSGLRVHHFGVVSNEARLAKAYAAADLFVAPSLADNLPNTVIEAMAAGVPVVGYDVGGMSDIVDDGQNGRLVAAGDVRALGSAMAELIGDGVARSRLATAAREKVVRQFALTKTVATHQTLYRRLCQAR